MMSINTVLLWVAALIFVSVVSSKLSDKFSIPVLLLFLGVGMLAGSEGVGGVGFGNARIAESAGLVALVFIIFAGGFDTKWSDIKPIIKPGMVLSTAGVLITALLTGLFAMRILKFSFLEAMLIGSIVSSTDAAAVFGVLRSKRIRLKEPLKPLLEFESGSNDPMAIFLTVCFISLLTAKDMSPYIFIPRFVLNMGVGALSGIFVSKFIIYLIKRLKLGYEGLYPVILVSLVLLTYSVTIFLKGSGFLAVYILGLMLSKSEFPNKKMMMKFHDGLAWLMQIVMFVMLGLLVYPSHIVPLIGSGLLLTLLLMVIARPVSVFLCLWPFKMSLREKIMVSWVGLRGSVPIILATMPFVSGIGRADTIFNVVFFVVFASVLIQGTSVPFVSRALQLCEPAYKKINYPIEFEKTDSIDADLADVIVPYGSGAVGKKIGDLSIPNDLLVMLVSRDGKFIIPKGSTVLEGGDVILALANKRDLALLNDMLS
ncbi:MAG: potassium/proton antiporter [Candidatus Omnitrophica bacterium]|jgi:cell volume regulation protein A|nr:potassium/proton antiporter [Candidatus Omnitrophota bacterium]